MEHIEIREMMPEDAEELIACMKKTGGETDNLTFGEEGLPVTIEQERAYLEQMHCAERSVTYGAWKEGKLVGNCIFCDARSFASFSQRTASSSGVSILPLTLITL